eukprot:CAMPEP_0196745574 /NCGR_PEP_ID=MMETSP1091-20130531/62291_1 /TAXON_ID=302021 /ORGANISM="Rhodomonas sp., Strain CCMP768" /LENGTH=213 /DNA_ID=CAMNT_0042092355 /DNA_START=264 /DNA_END=905 /DNA_ORIENTATION=+
MKQSGILQSAKSCFVYGGRRWRDPDNVQDVEFLRDALQEVNQKAPVSCSLPFLLQSLRDARSSQSWTPNRPAQHPLQIKLFPSFPHFSANLLTQGCSPMSHAPTPSMRAASSCSGIAQPLHKGPASPIRIDNNTKPVSFSNHSGLFEHQCEHISAAQGRTLSCSSYSKEEMFDQDAEAAQDDVFKFLLAPEPPPELSPQGLMLSLVEPTGECR